MKVCLFTDTLGDLNGVSRFIQDMGEQAFLAASQPSGHSENTHTERAPETPSEAPFTEPSPAEQPPFQLVIATATRKPLPDTHYIHNLPCYLKMPMPFYQELDLVWPKKRAIRKFLQAHQPDKVHISTPGPFGWAAKQEAEKLGIPLIGTYHTDFPAYLYDLTRSHWVKRQTDNVMAKFYQAFDHVFSRSDAYLDIMRQDIRLTDDKISTLFPGTHLERFHPQHAQASVWQTLGLPASRLKVLYVGRINVEKNIPFLLEVWKDLMQHHPELEADLVMVGEGRYRKLAKQMKPYHAYFAGPIRGETLSQLYASADVFVFPSVTDTLGQVIMEAQASGLGCLVSDVGGPQSLIQHDHSGWVLKANDRQIWQTALAQILKQPDIRHTWKRNSRPNMETYDIVTSFDQFRQRHLHKSPRAS